MGTQAAPTPHGILVSWQYAQGVDVAVSFQVQRSPVSGGPYAVVNPTPLGVAATSFLDTTVAAGKEYFYVVTALDSNGVSSVNSNEASATVEAIPNAPTGVTAVNE